MESVDFSKAELERYSRHLIIPEFNIEGQRMLKQAKVLVVGTGGLGAPLLQYLAAAGVGTIGIVDFDVVDDSNLQRQVLFSVADIGRSKVTVARERLAMLNPHIQLVEHPVRLTSENALEIIAQYDVVADGTDNFPTRYLVNDACVLLGKTNVYASIFRFDGQVSVFNYRGPNGELGPNYRDIFPTPPPPGMVPSCAEGGVLGVLPGIIGSLQANEVLKVITGIGEPLSGRLFLFDALSFESRTLKIRRDPNNPLNGDHPTQFDLIDYVQFCGLSGGVGDDQETVHSISVQELLQMRQSKASFALIDVREPYEYEIANLGGQLIPLKTLPSRVSEIPRDMRVVVHCRTGKRSAEAVLTLQRDFGFENVFNLAGGILAYAQDIDPTMPKY